MEGRRKHILSGTIYIRAGKKQKCVGRNLVHKLEIWNVIQNGLRLLEKRRELSSPEREEIEYSVSRHINMTPNWIEKRMLEGYGMEIEVYSEREIESHKHEKYCKCTAKPDNFMLGEYDHYFIELHVSLIRVM
uniref:Alpha 2 protein n=1 Tax=Hefer Valley virus TaxID=3035973 RepID=A0AA49IF50_9RHAB|nr:alpha 2 protein [Hefer Valley virus]